MSGLVGQHAARPPVVLAPMIGLVGQLGARRPKVAFHGREPMNDLAVNGNLMAVSPNFCPRAWLEMFSRNLFVAMVVNIRNNPYGSVR